ncbi:hypothetical protein BKM78_14005 [Tessaracoccus sp. T2.5-30]|nr:hypothetical protein BKM78_14005 [Tessaracoccus sp. T2.5-30]
MPVAVPEFAGEIDRADDVGVADQAEHRHHQFVHDERMISGRLAHQEPHARRRLDADRLQDRGGRLAHPLDHRAALGGEDDPLEPRPLVVGITHSLAHAVGGHFPIAHGWLNAMLLPHVIAFNAERSPAAADRYARLGRLVTRRRHGRDRPGRRLHRHEPGPSQPRGPGPAAAASGLIRAGLRRLGRWPSSPTATPPRPTAPCRRRR